MPSFSTLSVGFKGLDVTNAPETGLPGTGKGGYSALRIADNMRLTLQGGVKTRSGFTLAATVGSGSAVDSIKWHPNFDVMFAKIGTEIYQTNDNWVTSYSVGVTRTASETDFLYPVRNNMLASNATDGLMRIACSKLKNAITVDSLTVDLAAGDGGVFPDSGTISIEGDSISYTGRTVDQLTGVTNISASHAALTIVTATEAQATLLATSISELENRTLLGIGKNIYYSRAYTLANPEYAYDFSGSGSGSKTRTQPVRALHSSSGIVLIGLAKGIDFASGFASDGTLTVDTLSKVHSVPSARSITDTESGFIVWTGRRVLPVSSDGNGTRFTDSTDSIPEAQSARIQMDYLIRNDLLELDDDQSSSWLHYDPFIRETSLTAIKDFISRDFVYNFDSKGWTKDLSKSFKCKTNTATRAYTGSDSTNIIYRDRFGSTDNGATIRHKARTPIYTVNGGRATSDNFLLTLGGVLSTNGVFTVRIYINSAIGLEQEITTDQLVQGGYMTIDTSPSAGTGIAGAESMNPGAGLGLSYPFTFPLEFFLTGERLEVEIEGYDPSLQLEIRSLQLDSESEGVLDSQNL